MLYRLYITFVGNNINISDRLHLCKLHPVDNTPNELLGCVYGQTLYRNALPINNGLLTITIKPEAI
jgi:hypothetical protein